MNYFRFYSYFLFNYYIFAFTMHLMCKQRLRQCIMYDIENSYRPCKYVL